jgi:hypothetical protein
MSYDGKERKHRNQRGLLDFQPDEVNTEKQKAEREQQKAYLDFTNRRWTSSTQAILNICLQKDMSLIDIQRELLKKCYTQIPELETFLRHDPTNSDTGYKVSGSFNCKLDGNDLCRMNCRCIDAGARVAVTVTWNIGSQQRVEKWLLSFIRVRTRVLIDDFKQRKIKDFVMLDQPDAVPIAFANTNSACRAVTLVSMRACLDSLTA